MYRVQLEQFEGPMDLLLSLIEKERLDITRVSLAAVTDQFLEHLSRESAPIEHLAGFLSVAARLILIKSQALLPTLSLTEEEEESADDLEARLREYRRFREAAVRLGGLFALGQRSFRRERWSDERSVFAPPKTVGVAEIRGAFQRVLAAIPIPVRLEERILEETVSMEERMEVLRLRMASRAEAIFSEVIAEAKDRVEVVVSFLALLELVRRRSFVVEQTDLFGEIRFRSLSESSS